MVFCNIHDSGQDNDFKNGIISWIFHQYKTIEITFFYRAMKFYLMAQ